MKLVYNIRHFSDFGLKWLFVLAILISSNGFSSAGATSFSTSEQIELIDNRQQPKFAVCQFHLNNRNSDGFSVYQIIDHVSTEISYSGLTEIQTSSQSNIFKSLDLKHLFLYSHQFSSRTYEEIS